MRLRWDVQVRFNVIVNPADFRLEPMLLIPFVENAFKHGIIYSGKSDKDISLDVANGFQQLKVENFLHRRNEDRDPASGIGLANVKRRLILLYPARHVLNIIEADSKFIVELKLSLNK